MDGMDGMTAKCYLCGSDKGFVIFKTADGLCHVGCAYRFITEGPEAFKR